MTATNGWIEVGEDNPTDGKAKSLLINARDYDSGSWHVKTRTWRDKYGNVTRNVTHWQDPPAPPTDPADEELEGLVKDSIKQDWSVEKTIAEIKAWKGRWA